MTFPHAASRRERNWHPLAFDHYCALTELARAMTSDDPTVDTTLLRVEQFCALVEEAELGRLLSDDWKGPLAAASVLWELRLDFDPVLARAYFHEPRQSCQDMTIVLLAHVKSVEGSAEEIAQQQTRYIREADSRRTQGERLGWEAVTGGPILAALREHRRE